MPRPKTKPKPPISEDFSRRVFVNRLAFMGGGVILLGSACDEKAKPSPNQPPPPPQKDGPAPTEVETRNSGHLTFNDAQFAVLTAAVDRVLPKDQDPGAVEAQVPVYIDRALTAQQLKKMRVDFVGGINALDRRCNRMYRVGFAAATPAQQDDVLTVAFKDAPESSGEAKWYDLLITLTMEGFLGDPSYGGNKDQLGWKTMGFDIIGHDAAQVAPGYDGKQHLDHLRCGTGKGC